ncbi:putative hydroxybutyrate dehydrogenase, partial [Byssothecium circinans]
MAVKGSVLITGCSDDGIGCALALSFVQNGYHVFATARNVASMSKLERLEHVSLLQLDVTDVGQIESAVKFVKRETGGKLTYLVNNAGQNRFMPLLDESADAAKRLFDVNVFGPLQLVQAFAPLLISEKGTIVFISSVSGYLNVPWQGIYAASKRSAEILADNFRVEMAPFGVKTISVVTGAVHTQGHTNYKDWSMPENSLYNSVRGDFIKRASGDDGAPRMDPHKYADGVVVKIIANPTPKFWYGASASFVRFAVSWLPTSWLDKGVVKGTGIDKLKSV